jgi:glyoxylase-like metal-dependent hydrolase (beta-lactamase superfamily II)
MALDFHRPRQVAPGIRVCPVRTPTLPPATHTNVWIVGETSLTVFDAASPWPDEQERLYEWIRALDRPVEQLVLTHHHHDHIGGVADLSDRLGGVPVFAHPITDARVPLDTVPWHPDEVRDCGGNRITAHFTPGHAPGHLAFHDAASGMLIAGDMVAGIGTIAIEPADGGHLGTYLDSLDALRALGPSALLPAHGPVLHEADSVLAFYIAHRHGRTDQIRRALDTLGNARPIDLAPHVYTELDPRFHPLAAVQISAHLIWLGERGIAVENDGAWSLVGAS